VYRPLQDAFSNDDEVAQLVNSLTEDGAQAVSQLSMPATAVMSATMSGTRGQS
jgi:hypothetical protein